MSLGKVIFHIDVNSAFLSWEAVYRLHHLGWKGDLREQVLFAVLNQEGCNIGFPIYDIGISTF